MSRYRKRKGNPRYPATAADSGERVTMHQWRAEQALGKPLPKGVVVHHATERKDDTCPLVICQDAAYHSLLHFRMRVKAAGGNPNTDRICDKCKTVKKSDQFPPRPTGFMGKHGTCRQCSNEMRRQRHAATL